MTHHARPLIAAMVVATCLSATGCYNSSSRSPNQTFGESVATGYRSLDLYLGEIDCGLEVGAITPETANALKADLLTAEKYLDQAVVGKLLWSDLEGYAPDELPMQAANKILAKVNLQLTEMFGEGC
jgi:hypothetical protein